MASIWSLVTWLIITFLCVQTLFSFHLHALVFPCLCVFFGEGDREGEGALPRTTSWLDKVYLRWKSPCMESIRAVQSLDCHWHLLGAYFQLIFEDLHLLKPDYNYSSSTNPLIWNWPFVWQRRMSFKNARFTQTVQDRWKGSLPVCLSKLCMYVCLYLCMQIYVGTVCLFVCICLNLCMHGNILFYFIKRYTYLNCLVCWLVIYQKLI